MTLRVVFRRAARAEFESAALWYEERQPGLGLQFISEIDRAVMQAAEAPDRYPIKHADIRCVWARRFPYSVFFRPETGRIVVLAVFHARRNPLVWQRRG